MVCSIPNVATRGEWGAPEPLETSNACRRDLVWSTPYGCPVCQRSEYHQSSFFFFLLCGSIAGMRVRGVLVSLTR
jgi:hypothetical protein